MAAKIAIAGCGFGGLYAARELERLLTRSQAQITVVNDSNYMLYTPLLPGAAGGTLEPRHVVVPVRSELKWADLMLGEVDGLDRGRNILTVKAKGGTMREIAYDHLVIALGSVSHTLPVEGLAEHGIGFKTLADAIFLRNHVIEQLELAESCDDAPRHEAHLGFVFVGGGYAGIEALAELHDFASELIGLYPRCKHEGMRWLLVEAAGTVLPEVDRELALFAMDELRGRGIEFRVNTSLMSCSATGATLSTGETIPAMTIVWTAGVEPSPVVVKLGLPLDGGGRIKVTEKLSVEGEEGIWAVGDAASVPDPAQESRPCPPSAQHAIRQGRAAAQNIAAALGTGQSAPFRYSSRGLVVDLGRHKAVVSIYGIKLRGFIAWWLARTYHLSQLPGLVRKLRLIVDWTVGLFFGRDSSELGTIGHPRKLE